MFINDTYKISTYKKNIIIYVNTRHKLRFSKYYVHLEYKISFLKSSSRSYILEFLKREKKDNSDVIEFHNRPSYLKYLIELKYAKKVLYFHNDPLDMSGSKKIDDRIYLIDNLYKIIFNRNWSKSRFIKNLTKSYTLTSKLNTNKQSNENNKLNINKKKQNKI